MALGWYVARFYAGMEAEGMRAVNKPDAQAFCPLRVVSWVRRGVKREQRVPVISGYGFVQMRRHRIGVRETNVGPAVLGEGAP